MSGSACTTHALSHESTHTTHVDNASHENFAGGLELTLCIREVPYLSRRMPLAPKRLNGIGFASIPCIVVPVEVEVEGAQPPCDRASLRYGRGPSPTWPLWACKPK